MLAFLEILDADRLAEAKATDERYAVAKLVARAFNDPKSLWDEHLDVRSDLLADEGAAGEPDEAVTAAMWAETERIHQMMLAHKILPPHGAN